MLNQYAEKLHTEAFKKYHAFFAFSDRQFDESKEEQFKGDYISLGSGLIVPAQFAKDLVDTLSDITKKSIEQVKANNTMREIIWYELGNHEAQITYDIEDTYQAVNIYGITREDIKAVFPDYMEYCIKHDYF